MRPYIKEALGEGIDLLDSDFIKEAGKDVVQGYLYDIIRDHYANKVFCNTDYPYYRMVTSDRCKLVSKIEPMVSAKVKSILERF